MVNFTSYDDLFGWIVNL